MELIEKVEEILMNIDSESVIDKKYTDLELNKKYAKRIPRGFYGFDTGVLAWNKALSEIIDLCIANDPDFEIHQVKIKFGGVRFYVATETISEISVIQKLIQMKLYDEKLKY